MLIGNIDTFEFGVMFRKNKEDAISLLNRINKLAWDLYEIKIYYTSSKGYNDGYFDLASKARIKRNNRYKFIAFLFIKSLDIHIPVIQHSSSKYLTFKFYGLFQEDAKSYEKRKFTFIFINSLIDLGYILRNVKIDIAFDFNANFNTLEDRLIPIFEKRNRYPYIFKENQTVYFNTKKVNKCLFKQKRTHENLACNQKNCYFNIVLYNKGLKNSLDYEVSRLEFCLRGQYFNNNERKFITTYEDLDILIENIEKKINKYLNSIYHIEIVRPQQDKILTLNKVAANNVHFLKKIS